MTDRNLRYVVEINAEQAAAQIAELRRALAKEITAATSSSASTAAPQAQQAAATASAQAASAMASATEQAAAAATTTKTMMDAAARSAAMIANAMEKIDLLDSNLDDQSIRVVNEIHDLQNATKYFDTKVRAEWRDWSEKERTRASAERAISNNLVTYDRKQYETDPARFAPSPEPAKYTQVAYEPGIPGMKERSNKEFLMTTAKIQDTAIDAEKEQRRIFDEMGRINNPSAEQIAEGTRRLAENEEQAAAAIKKLADDYAALEEDIARDIARMQAQTARRHEIDAAKKAGQVIPPTPGQLAAAGGSGVVTTQQAAITISDKSAANAKEILDSMRDMRQIDEKWFTGEAERHKKRIDMERQLFGDKSKHAADLAAVEDKRIQLTKERKDLSITQRQTTHEAAEAKNALELEKQRTLAARERATTTTQAAAAERAANAIVTNESKAATADRIQGQKRLTALTTAEARTRATKEIEQEKRTTAQVKAELRERGQAAGGSRGLALPNAASAFYMAQEIAQYAGQAYDQGKTGAQQLRQLETFAAITARARINGRELIDAVKAASRGTVSEMDAITLSTNVLARKFSDNRKSITADIAQLVGASRRLAQVYTDENGAFLTTRDVFARLVKYIGEGNKELVDQFGISNARIAESLGTSVAGLASATGAGQRFQGLLQVLAEDQARFGDASIGAADKLEASEARIADAWSRILQASAEPTANLADFGANVIEQIASPQALAVVQRRIADAIKNGMGEGTLNTAWDNDMLLGAMFNPVGAAAMNIQKAMDNARPETIESYQALAEQITAVSEAAAAGDPAAAQFQTRLLEMGDALANNPLLFAEMRSELDAIAAAFAATQAPAGNYQKALQKLGELAATQSAETDSSAKRIQNLATMYSLGQITGAEFNKMLESQITLMGYLKTEADAAAIAAANVAALARGGGVIYDYARDMYKGYSATEIELLKQYEVNPATYAGRGAISQTPETQRQRLQREAATREEQERIAADKSAAEKAASAFEAAADRAAAAFESALTAVPGLFGTSSVTQDQLDQAAAGIPQNFADDYLRRLSDEVLNKTDYADVDINDAARRAGIDGSLDPKAILALFKSAWEDSSLFAGGQNLDLINKDAVTTSLARTEASKSGEAAIKALFGIDQEEITTAGAAARSTFDAGFYGTGDKTTDETNSGSASYVANLSAAITQDLTGSDTAKRLFDIGSGMVDSLNSGFMAALADLTWGQSLIDNLAGAVAGPVFTMLEDRF